MTHSEFKKVFLPLYRQLYGEAYKLLCDKQDAEDAVQTLYLKLWERRDELAGVLSPLAFSVRVLKNICIDRYRAAGKEYTDSATEIDDVVVAVVPEIEHRECESFLQEFLSALPPVVQNVMRMKMNGCSYDDIAECTGLSATNVRVIISRVRKRFREYYNK